MQLQAANHLSEIDGWEVEGKEAYKDGLTLHLLENGNALTKSPHSPVTGFAV